jgi:dihydroorotase-like cyclic amidohydrolase
VHTGGYEGLERILCFYSRAGETTSELPVLYICHVSKGEEIKLLKKWKKKYPSIMIEVTPHHLFLNRNDYGGLPGVLPPLESRKDVDALWEGIQDGTVDTLGTDHAPHTVVEKSGENPPSGFPGLETAIPLLLTAWKNRRLTLKALLRLTSENAGRLFNLSDRTFIKSGLQADCAVFSEGSYVTGEDGYETKCGWSPFHGEVLNYKTVLTAVRGRAAYDNGRFYKPDLKPLQIS